MKILMVHNYYRKMGGERISFEAEVRLLLDHGNKVILYTRDNSEINETSIAEKFSLAAETIWSKRSFREIYSMLMVEQPDIVHFQNTFPLISPSGYYACKKAGIPVVQSIRNYRLFCPAGIFFRNNEICELCMGKSIPWPGILHGCYRNSQAKTAVVAAMLTYHRMLNTWNDQVDVFIALTEFVRSKLISGGINKEKIYVKPNFVEDFDKQSQCGEQSICVGRLTNEKNIMGLLAVWKNFPNEKLVIVGDGPLRQKIEAQIDDQNLNNIQLLGHVEKEKVLELISKSKYLIFPTKWYETFGRVVIEAYSCSVPVLASRIGAVEELVIDGKTGLLFNPYDLVDFKEKVNWMVSHPAEVEEMGKNARIEYEEKYTPEQNYRQLMDIYTVALNK